MMAYTERDAGQDKALKDLAVPCAHELFARWRRRFPDDAATGWKDPVFDASGRCDPDKVKTIRCSQASRGGGIYRTFSIRLSRTGPDGVRTTNTEYKRMGEFVAMYPGRTVLFAQVYVTRVWKAPVIDAACAKLWDILAMCTEDRLRQTAPDPKGYVSEFYYVPWDEMARVHPIEILSEPEKKPEPVVVEPKLDMHNLFGEGDA